MSIDVLVGRVAASLIVRALSEAQTEMPVVRVSGFTQGEVIQLCSVLEGVLLDGQEKALVLVVAGADDSEIGVPTHQLDPERTLTWYRDHLGPNGTVLVELNTQPDSEGLATLFHIGDDALLNGSVVGLDEAVRLLNVEAWEVHGGTGDCPEAVHREILRVFHGLYPEGGLLPPLRRWTSLVDRVVSSLIELGRPISATDVRHSISIGIAALGLFPDPELFAEGSDPVARRRLQTNVIVSEFRHPSGREMRDNELRETIESAELIDSSGQKLTPEANEGLRARMQAVADGYPGARSQVQLSEWLQIFDAKRTQAALGTRVKEYLRAKYHLRVPEFVQLDLVEDLNADSQAAAQALCDAIPASPELQPLIEILSSPLRKRVRHLAAKRGVVADPIRAMIEELFSVGIEGRDISEHLHLESTNPQTRGLYSRRLMALLYGPLLKRIVDGTLDGDGRRLTVAADLLRPGVLSRPLPDEAELESGPGDVDEGGDQAWEPLKLRMSLDDGSSLFEMLWDPRRSQLISFGRLIAEDTTDCRIDVSSAEDLELNSAAPEWLLPRVALSNPMNQLTRGWLERKREWFSIWKKEGLDANSVEGYVTAYTELLNNVSRNCLPQAAPNPDLDSFLDLDMAWHGSDRSSNVMLATHPIHLRWFGQYLRLLERDFGLAVQGELRLNEENEDFYFRRLSLLSPHQQPALYSPGAEVLQLAGRESGRHEEFISGALGGKTEQIAVDDASVRVMAGVVARYLAEYPHKSDGIAVLVLDPDGESDLGARFVKALDDRTGRNAVTLHLHVMAPGVSHARIAESLAPFDRAGGRDDNLFPSFQVVLHDWSDLNDLSILMGLTGSVDVALVADLFGSDSNIIVSTRSQDDHRAGSFDSLKDRPTHHVDPGMAADLAAVEELLPPRPDPLLEAWSTANVRRFRSAPVADDQPDNLDVARVQVKFAAHLDLFNGLHDVAHWVVTLDRFVGRTQVDAVPQRPDVILVEEGVGKNESYTLVVSSNAGRRFVTERLARKLISPLELVSDRDEALVIAGRLYDVGRNVVPGIMLRALGLGRTIEEAIGLIVARRRVEDYAPWAPDRGLDVWISLDDFTDWFGGPQNRRADLLRLSFDVSTGTMLVRGQVIESKFRGSDDIGNAAEQIGATRTFMIDALGDPKEEMPPADREMWLRVLADSLGLAPTPLEAEELPAMRAFGGPHHEVLRDVREALLDRSYEVLGIEGIVCSTNSVGTGEDEMEFLEDGTVILRTRRHGLLEAIGAIKMPGGPTTARESSLGSASTKTEERDENTSDSDARDGDEDIGGTTEVGRDLFGGEGGEAVSSEAAVSNGESGTEDHLGPETALRRGMSPGDLDDIYQLVVSGLESHNVGVEIPEEARHDQGPGFYVLRLRPAVGVPVSRIQNRVPEIKLLLELTQDQDIRQYIDRGALVLEVPKSASQRHAVITEDLWREAEWPSGALYSPIGEDINGAVVGINFSAPTTPHLLIAGTTGSGKTIALESLLAGLCCRHESNELRLHLIDPKGTELLRFEDDPHTEGPIGYDGADAIELLEAMVTEMQRRYESFKKRHVRTLVDYNALQEVEAVPWRVIVLDEYADLTSAKDERKRIEEELQRLAQKGRAAGIHLIVATQRPSADVITPVVRSNLPAQLALRVRTAVDSRIIIDEAGAETLAGSGDALFRTSSGLVRVQCGILRGAL